MVRSQSKSVKGNRGRRRERRRQRDASEWRALIEQQRVSGQTVKAFCADHDVGEASFYAWRRHFRDQASQPYSASNPADAPDASQPDRGTAGFVRLEPQATAPRDAIEVRFACGATLCCDPSHLPELVRLLKHEGGEADQC